MSGSTYAAFLAVEAGLSVCSSCGPKEALSESSP
jgi:hypothetical protein